MAVTTTCDTQQKLNIRDRKRYAYDTPYIPESVSLFQLCYSNIDGGLIRENFINPLIYIKNIFRTFSVTIHLSNLLDYKARKPISSITFSENTKSRHRLRRSVSSDAAINSKFIYNSKS